MSGGSSRRAWERSPKDRFAEPPPSERRLRTVDPEPPASRRGTQPCVALMGYDAPRTKALASERSS